MTAQIETRNNPTLELCERLRKRRAFKYSTPDHGQIVDGADLDMAIMLLAQLALRADQISRSDYARFQEAWFDK